jgi:outer membrane protein, multidrug efflux system
MEELGKEGPIPPKPPKVPMGLPSELLRRRPDVRQAERLMAAATAQIGVATAQLFPQITLTGTIGPQTRDFRHFLDAASMAWAVGPGVSWPIFQGGAIRGNIEVRGAQAQQAMIAYQSVVLVALEDTEDALVSYSREIERHQMLAEAVEASQQAFSLANERYSRGLSDFLSVLDSQRSLYLNQAQLVQSEQQVTSDLIALYKALGGGWQTSLPTGQRADEMPPARAEAD